MAGRRGGVVVPISTEFNSKGLQQAQAQLNGFGKSITKSFKGIGASIGAAFALGAVTDQVAQMVTAASNLAESQSKVNVVFGQSAKQINDWASTSSTSLLMTKQAALEAAGTYGNLFQAFGIGQSQAQQMSTTLVQLAADLASFNNTSVDDAIQALRSGLSGETEPLKRFGVALTDVRLRQEALNMGIYDGKGILTTAQKAQASYNLILRDTKLAQGDVARTADGYANTMRAVQAAVGNAQAIIGTQLLDSVNEVTTAVGGPGGMTAGIEGAAQAIADLIDVSNNAIGPLTTLAGRIDSVVPDWLGTFYDAGWSRVFGPLGGFIDTMVVANNATELAGEAAAQLTQGYVRMGPAAQQASTGVDAVATGVADTQKNAVKATTALDRLKAQLDKLQGKTSIKRQRLDLKDLLDQGPAKSGERTITGADGKKRTVQFSTERDKKRFALDVADARRGLALDVFNQGMGSESAKERARRILRNGRGNVAGLGIGDYTQGLFSVPGEFRAGTNQQRLVASMTGQSPTTVNYNFGGDIVVQSSEALRQAAKEAKRLAALSGSRYAGMAETGRGY